MDIKIFTSSSKVNNAALDNKNPTCSIHYSNVILCHYNSIQTAMIGHVRYNKINTGIYMMSLVMCKQRNCHGEIGQ